MLPVTRIIIVTLDGVGAGELPDAAAYGDEGSNTLAHTSEAVGGLNMACMQSLGLGNIVEIAGVPAAKMPRACWGKMKEASAGKDTITGHWEIAGVVLDRPFPTYPNGFPQEVIGPFEQAIGARVLGNKAASGTEIIQELGEQHLRTGYPIVYTSADSVFQVAMHEDVAPVEKQYAICQAARRLLTGKHEVGRVICRPFAGAAGSFRRTENRRDFSVSPPQNLLDVVQESGRQVHAIGKIYEIFAGRAISTFDHTTNNPAHTLALQRELKQGSSALVFANLEDFDMLYGHRNDPYGMAAALEEWDRALPAVLNAMRPSDLLILTADHGNDPTTPSTDHSREYPFLLAYHPLMRRGCPLGTRQTFADISATCRRVFDLPAGRHGASFAGLLQ